MSRVDPWSVMKFSFLLSLVGFVVLVTAVAVLYAVLNKLGVFTSIEHTCSLVTSGKKSAGTNCSGWFTASHVIGYTVIAAAVNVALITALTTLGAVVYNLISSLTGGIDVTLRGTD